MSLYSWYCGRHDAEDLGFGRVEVEVAGVGDDDKNGIDPPESKADVVGGNGNVITEGSHYTVERRNEVSHIADNGVHGNGKEHHGQRAALFDSRGECEIVAKLAIREDGVFVVGVKALNGTDVVVGEVHKL